jgi:hypothetical protein
MLHVNFNIYGVKAFEMFTLEISPRYANISNSMLTIHKIILKTVTFMIYLKKLNGSDDFE